METDKKFAEICKWCAKHGYTWRSRKDGKQVVVDKKTNRIVRIL